MVSTENQLGVSVSALASEYTHISNNTFDHKITLDSDLNLQSSSQSLNPKNELVIAAKNPNPNPIFSDAAIVADFNGDGKTDRFWRNAQTGETAVWLLDGVNQNAAFLKDVDSSWDFAYADFNGDNKTDIFWRNKNTGENVIWQMDGTNISSEESVQVIGSNWNFSIADDFCGTHFYFLEEEQG